MPRAGLRGLPALFAILSWWVVAAPAVAQAPLIQPGHSAFWHSPERASGEGWVLEILDGARANLFWFTYDEQGNPRWLTGVGTIDNATIRFPELIVTRGGRFAGGAAPDEIVREVIGTAEIRFDDCQTGTFEFAAFGQSGTIAIQRLGRTAAVACPPATSGKPVRPVASLSGTWHDGARSGEGIALQWLDRGEAIVTWFTYDSEGNQFWLIGTGRPDGSGGLEVEDLHFAHGPAFGRLKPDPAAVQRFAWGEVRLELDCLSGAAEYQSELAEFGNGRRELGRLTMLAGVGCPLFMPAVGEIADAAWDKRFHIAGVSSSFFGPPQIYDFAVADNGEIMATGQFTWFGPDMVAPLLQRDAESGEWTPTSLPFDTLRVSALANDPDHGLVWAEQAGVFQSLAFVPPTGRVVLLEDDGPRIIGEFDGAIRRLQWHDRKLWAAGWFEMEDGGASHLAVWDGASWQPPPGGGPDSAVFALEPDGGGLLIGGEFSTIGGIQAVGVARYDGQDWTAFDLPGRVYTVTRFDGQLHAAGYLDVPDFDAPSGGVARWNGDAWEVVGAGLSNGLFAGVASDLAAFKGDLYAVGCFRFANGPPEFADSEPAAGIARWIGDRWESLDSGARSSPGFFFQEGVCGDEPFPAVAWVMEWQRLGTDGEYLYIGGAFPGIDGVDSHSLIAFDGERFVAQGEAGLGRSNDYLSQLAIGGPDAGVYGLVRVFDGAAPMAIHVARFDHEAGWQAFGPPLPVGDTCQLESDGLAIAPDGGVVIACRDLKLDIDVGGRSSVARVLQLAGDQWIDLAGIKNRRPIRKITLDPDGNLWIAGGIFFGQEESGYIARLEGEVFRIVEDRFDGPVSQLSFAPEAEPDGTRSFVAGGAFTRIGDLEVNYIARREEQSWQALGDGLVSPPQAIEHGSGRIYASDSDQGRNGALSLGVWDGQRWTELATAERNFPPLDDDASPWFQEIREVGSRLFLAGNIVPPLEDWDEFGPYLYVFENGRFHSLGGGVSAPAERFEIRHDAVWVIGDLIEADPAGEPVSSPGLGRLYWP